VAASPSSVADRRVRRGTRLRPGVWVDVAKATVRGFLADDCLGLAQEVAFSSLLAFFPAVILLIGLLGLIGPSAYDSLKSLLGTVAPQAVLQAIDLAKKSSGGSAGSAVAFAAGTAGALWAASGATGAVIKAVNRANDLKETRPFWRVRLLALGLVLLMGLVIGALFVLIVFGGPLGDAIARKAHLGGAFQTVWALARWPIAFAGILLLLAIVYYLAPSRRPASWKWITPGSLLGALLWLGISALFALYTSFSSSYDRTYGSLAGGIILLLWLDYSALALLLGAELNAELERRAEPCARP
jgi:membrane protein